MTRINQAITERVIEGSEKLRGLLRELREITSEYAWDADLEARVDAALSQQTEPDHVEDMRAMVEPAPAQDERWAVHAQGPDELYAAFSREDAEQHAAALNTLSMPAGIQVSAIVVESPWPAAEHWKYLAEQERDHVAELRARVTRPAQAEQSRWISVEDRLPPVRQILSDSCVLEGKEIPALYRSTDVICWDGKRVGCQIVEWFHAKMPISGVTHWMPLPAAPAQGAQ